MLPGEESQDRARRADLVAEVEMLGAGIVKIDGSLDQALSQQFVIEIYVGLGIASNGRYVVNALDGFHSWVAL